MADCRGRAGAGRRGTPNFLLFLNTFRTGSSVGTGAQALNCCNHRGRNPSEPRGAAGSVRGNPSQLERARLHTEEEEQISCSRLRQDSTSRTQQPGRRNRCSESSDVHSQPIL